MATWRPNERGLYNVLQGRGGPVYKLVDGFAEATETGAKFEAPVDTGALRASIQALPPHSTLDGVTTTVKAGARHGMVVHQGRRAIVPVRAPQLRFYWKRIGAVYQTNYVAPRAGRPFLVEGMHHANNAFRTKFRIVVKRPWRMDGS